MNTINHSLLASLWPWTAQQFTWRKIVGDDVGGDVSGQHHLKPSQGEVTEGPVVQDSVLWWQWVDFWNRNYHFRWIATKNTLINLRKWKSRKHFTTLHNILNPQKSVRFGETLILTILRDTRLQNWRTGGLEDSPGKESNTVVRFLISKCFHSGGISWLFSWL